MKNQKPFYQRTWFIVVCVLVVIGAIGNATSEKTETKPTQKEVSENDQRQVNNKEESSTGQGESVVEEDKKVEEAADTEWKQFLLEYEAWVDEYIIFMEKYQENSSDLGLLADYSRLMLDMVEWSEKADVMQEDLSEDDLVEYMKIMTRIAGKLTGAAF